MKNLKGLYTDCYEKDQPAGTYRFAKNLLLSNTLGAFENEPGMVAHANVVPGTAIVGIVPMGAEFAVFSRDTNLNIDHIGYCKFVGDTLNYTSVYSGALGFDISSPIKGEYQINSKGERIVAWIEVTGNNPPRIINIDNPEVDSTSDLNLFPTYTIARVTVNLNNTGGTLLTSTIVPIYRYKKTDGSVTQWNPVNDVISIIDEPTTVSVYAQDGAPAGTPSTKSITLTFTQIDTTYNFVEIGYIQQKGGVTQAFSAGEIIAALNAQYTITGGGSTVDLSLDEVLAGGVSYKGAKAITQLNNQLLLANLTSDDVIDGQPIANKVIVNYNVQTRKLGPTFKAGGTRKAFQTGEVYALYLIFDLIGGGSVAYHIPGRGSEPADLQDDSTTISGITAKRFQINDTSARPGAVSNMAYWENANETYPVGFPPGLSITGVTQTLAGQKVRHHKFPDMDTLLDRHFNGGTTLAADTIPFVVLDVSNVVIPSDIQAKISAWRIGYAKRTYNNSLVIAPDTLQLAADTSAGAGLIWTTAGNWNIKATAGDGDNGWGDLQIWKNPLSGSSAIRSASRGHSADLLFDKPGVVPSYVHFISKLRKGDLNVVYNNPGDAGGLLIRSGDGAGQCPGEVVDWTLGTRTTLPGTRKATVSNFQYIPQNTQVGNISTKLSEEIVYCEINNLYGIVTSHGTSGILDVNPPGIPWTSFPIPQLPVFLTYSSGHGPAPGNLSDDGSRLDYESTYYFYYKQLLAEVYGGFGSQPIVITSDQATPGQTSNGAIAGGDVSLCLVSYMAMSVMSPTVENDQNAATQGLRIFKHYLAECRHNWNYRHEASPSIEDRYAPKTNPKDFWSPRANNGSGVSLIDTIAQRLNKLSYNTDYDLVNEFKPVTIVEDIEDFSSSGPTTIIYTPPQNLESRDVSWTTFPPGNRYVQNRNRGPITNLQGFNNKELIIHHRDSLFITQANLSLTGDTDDIRLKAGELFSIAPKEILATDEGYAGTQHSLACKMTKLGYTFIDDSQAKLFAFDGQQLQELSRVGMRNFFREELHLGRNLVAVPNSGEVLSNPNIDGAGDGWSQTTPDDTADMTLWSFNNAATLFTATKVNWKSRTCFSEAVIDEGATTVISVHAGVLTGAFNPILFGVFLDSDRRTLKTISFGPYAPGVGKATRTQTTTAPAGTNYVGFYLAAGNTGEPVAGFEVDFFKVNATSVRFEERDQNNPFNASGYTLAYDERFDRLIVTKKDTIGNKSLTASYAIASQSWVSFHDYIPDYIFPLSNMRLISLKGKLVYENNKGAVGEFFGEKKPMLVDVVFNIETEIDKVVTFLSWASAVYNGNTLVPDESVNYLTLRSEDKTTGKIAISRQNQIDQVVNTTTTAREINQTWFYNNFYDISIAPGFVQDFYNNYNIDVTKLNSNMPWYQRRKFIDKYVVCRFEYSNISNYRFRLLDTEMQFRSTER